MIKLYIKPYYTKNTIQFLHPAPDPVFSCNGKKCGETCKRPGEKDVGKCNDQGHCIPFPWTGLSCRKLKHSLRTYVK